MKRVILEIPEKISDVISLVLIGKSGTSQINVTSVTLSLDGKNGQILVLDANDSSKTHWKSSNEGYE